MVAHEFTHIINYDIRLMLLVSALGNALLLFTDFLFRFVGLGSTGRSSSNNDNKGPGGAIVILFLAIFVIRLLLPVFNLLMLCYLSRQENIWLMQGLLE